MREMDVRDWDKYEFTRAWFCVRNLVTFREVIHPRWAGLPITYLELGVFEGLSLVWMFQHVLTHPDSRAVGIDSWLPTTKMDDRQMEEVMNRAFRNVSEWWWGNRCRMMRMSTDIALRKMAKKHDGKGLMPEDQWGFLGIKEDSVDLCLVDASHYSLGVYDDARHVLPLMKRGGWMVFDDIDLDIKKQPDGVKLGVDLFLSQFGDRVKLVAKRRYVEVYEKL